MKLRPAILIAASLATIAASAWFSARTLFASPAINAALHQGVGEALAEETARALGHQGEIIVITMSPGDSPVLDAQLEAFRAALERIGSVSIRKVVTIDSDKASQYGPGSGLSASKLAREVKKRPDASAIVSFVGLPSLDDAELQALGERVPPLIVFSRDLNKLDPLFRKQLVRAAIVPRFQFPAPGPEQPRTPRDWFVQQFQRVAFEEPPPEH